ncbi:Rpn family recombination-promoting nuclease/putative transposase [candidate division KSB1 bacterium]|nr:Rpn family recombination-promoting nuclease/putative transposase [candidate division KSB1 bacterium]
MQFADPRTDFAFKLIFGNEKAKEVLISFLNAVLGLEGIHAISEVTILNPYQAPKIPTLKHSFLDVKCRDHRGVEFVVETQVQYAEGFEKRIQYNACKAYVGQIPTGTDYPKLNQVIGITIVDFVLFKEFDHYLSCHEFRETISNHCYLDEIRHYFIELPKFTKSEAELETTIEKWCYFLKHAGHLEMIPEKLNQEPFRKAFEMANRANMTKEEWEAYDAAAVKMQDERGIATAARKEGKEEGRQEGREEGREEGKQERSVEIARSMRQQGLDTNLIAEMTGLSVEVIKRL